jgi:hypothetical protein
VSLRGSRGGAPAALVEILPRPDMVLLVGCAADEKARILCGLSEAARVVQSSRPPLFVLDDWRSAVGVTLRWFRETMGRSFGEAEVQWRTRREIAAARAN